jgi:hypothetical protein
MPPRDEEAPEPEPQEGPVLAPEELDIAEDDHVTQIDDGRYVVSPETRPADDPREVDESPEETEQVDVAESAGGPDLDRGTVHDWLADDLGRATSRYGFDVTATFGDGVSQRRMVSNDVVTIFENLVLWYAQQIDADTPVEEVLGILLLETNVPVRYPPRSLRRLIKSANLGPDDTIADLLAAVDAEDGVEL